MSEIRVQLHSWLRLQREALPLAVRADALRRTLQACPEVRQAFFLGWQAATGIYSHEGAAAHLPPGFGDPLQASDLLLFERLQVEPRLSLGELRQLPCWLAGRVRRAAISHGQVLALELDAGQACLQQGRAIDGVEAQVEGQILIWLFIPDPLEQQVLARCRLATEQVQAEREAAKASRLYRLITENTTDLISRHTPEGRFLDASPARWTLLGYWPEELRGTLVQALFHEQDQLQLVQSTREALEQDGYHTMTYRIRHRAGHYLWFETANRAIRETYTGAVVEDRSW